MILGVSTDLAASLTSGTLYNAYADDLLDLRLFPHSAREIQDAWYYKQTGKFTHICS